MLLYIIPHKFVLQFCKTVLETRNFNTLSHLGQSYVCQHRIQLSKVLNIRPNITCRIRLKTI